MVRMVRLRRRRPTTELRVRTIDGCVAYRPFAGINQLCVDVDRVRARTHANPSEFRRSVRRCVTGESLRQ